MFRKYLSARIQYNIWLLLLILLAVPFLPIRLIDFWRLFLRLSFFDKISATDSALQMTENTGQSYAIDKVNDFAISISSQTPSFLTVLFLSIWITGMVAMVIFMFRSYIRLYCLEKSALPLQNNQVRQIYNECLSEMGIKKPISIYSTAFLKSPVTAGFLHPRIYMPIHLISDFNPKDMRYMLLHELQHYRHKDVLIGYFMNLCSIIYWFNPLVWYALREMKCDREIACDSSVLHLLHESDYEDYGNTLINFAEKIFCSSFPFTAGMGGNMKQISRRLLNIANFKRETYGKKIRGIVIYFFIAAFLIGLAPALSTYAADQEYYIFHEKGRNVAYLDLTSEFSGFYGSFVLYDEDADTWKIYNKDAALKRVTPNSTYKIYNALLGLESGIITPEYSEMIWDGKDYPFDTWESDQNLTTAMQNSVNWYFQTIDRSAGTQAIKTFLKKVEYGNQKIGDDLDLYWTDCSLKISPVEQVELLEKFYHNDFRFSDKNVNSVKKAIRLSSTDNSSFYGKTGTGRIDGRDINGWFIGYIEKSGHVYYFATNIQGDSGATGSKATEITESILSKFHIWEQRTVKK